MCNPSSLPNPVLSATESLRAIIAGAFRQAQEEGVFPAAEMPAFVVEIPADTRHGDFASNIAMASARALRMAPQKIAAALIERFTFSGTP